MLRSLCVDGKVRVPIQQTEQAPTTGWQPPCIGCVLSTHTPLVPVDSLVRLKGLTCLCHWAAQRQCPQVSVAGPTPTLPAYPVVTWSNCSSKPHSHCSLLYMLQDIDAGKLWPNRPAPDIAKSYWWLGEDATMRDLILAVRADEACHSHVNHTLAKLQADQTNPFLGKNSHMVP